MSKATKNTAAAVAEVTEAERLVSEGRQVVAASVTALELAENALDRAHNSDQPDTIQAAEHVVTTAKIERDRAQRRLESLERRLGSAVAAKASGKRSEGIK